MFTTSQDLQQSPEYDTKSGMKFCIIINYNHNQSGRNMIQTQQK